jgi:hypothetical protein
VTEPLDPLLDLSPEALAATLIDRAQISANLVRLQAAGGALLAGQPGGDFLLEELARLAAAQDRLAQQHRAAALTRAERLRIDPLRHIPPERLTAARAPALVPEAGPAVMHAADPAFAGHGWYAPETTPAGALRWAGMGRCATLALPALGGGALRLALSLRAPFGRAVDLAAHDWFLDGVRLDLVAVGGDGASAVAEAVITLPEHPPGSRVTLLWCGPATEDPATGPRRDTRRLGLALHWARIERA